MGRVTIDVIPEMLDQVANLVQPFGRIIGSDPLEGAVRLVLASPKLPDGHISPIVERHTDGHVHTITTRINLGPPVA